MKFGTVRVEFVLNLGALLITSLLLAPPANAELPRYQVKDLGTLGGRMSWPYGINNAGQVTGESERTYGTGDFAAFLYSDGMMEELVGASVGWAINNSGHVTGNAGGQAFLYVDGTLNLLGVPNGEWSFGVDINDADEIVGWSGNASFLYRDGEWVDLSEHFPLLDGDVYAINNLGDMTGFTFTGPGTGSAFILSRDGRLEYVGTLGGTYSIGFDINDTRQVTGYSPLAAPSGEIRAFLYSDNAITDLGTLGDFDPTSQAFGEGINNIGQVVGSSSGYAFLYENGHMLDLNQLISPDSGFYLATATAINDLSQIVGIGTGGAVLLTPITLLLSRLLDGADIVPGNSLTNAVASAQAYYDADDGVGTCGALDLFRMKVLAHSGKKIARPVAEALIEDATDIKDGVGCQQR